MSLTVSLFYSSFGRQRWVAIVRDSFWWGLSWGTSVKVRYWTMVAVARAISRDSGRRIWMPFKSRRDDHWLHFSPRFHSTFWCLESNIYDSVTGFVNHLPDLIFVLICLLYYPDFTPLYDAYSLISINRFLNPPGPDHFLNLSPVTQISLYFTMSKV